MFKQAWVLFYFFLQRKLEYTYIYPIIETYERFVC